jgi:flagellar biosynthetic protein FliP
MIFLRVVLLTVLLTFSTVSAAPRKQHVHSAEVAPDSSLFGVSLANNAGAKSVNVPLQIALLLSALTVLPAIIMCVTPFLRITLILHFLRQALGTQTVPSNQVLVGLSLFLTLLVMNPVIQQIYTQSWKPLDEGKISVQQAVASGSQPLRHFLAHYAREKDIKLFLELSHSPRPANVEEVTLSVLVPSFIISEMRTGFQIGAVLYLPFLIVDLVVASITVSVGMMQLPPALVSAPFKILLFVLVDGWNLIAGSMVRSFF